MMYNSPEKNHVGVVREKFFKHGAKQEIPGDQRAERKCILREMA